VEHGFLIHGEEDHVGVAIRDLKPGETVSGRYLASPRTVTVSVREPVALGHKIALTDLAWGCAQKIQ
jgi:(2R)-sulfolactate sulfo-lyase subunit alpha